MKKVFAMLSTVWIAACAVTTIGSSAMAQSAKALHGGAADKFVALLQQGGVDKPLVDNQDGSQTFSVVRLGCLDKGCRATYSDSAGDGKHLKTIDLAAAQAPQVFAQLQQLFYLQELGHGPGNVARDINCVRPAQGSFDCTLVEGGRSDEVVFDE